MLKLRALNRRYIYWLLFLILVAGIVYFSIPKPDIFLQHSFSAAYYDRHGYLLRLTLAHDERYRLWTPIEQISPDIQKATLLYEDRYFYQHPGINPFSLFRAIYATYITRQRRIGASTITMQLARLSFGLETNSIGGKIRQILYALQIERHYTKKEILEAYLNLAPYGLNIEGIGAASLVYFEKNNRELTLPEILFLVSIPQSPEKRNPVTSAGQKNIDETRKELFDLWIKEYPEDSIKNQFIDMSLNVSRPSDLPFRAPHFVDRVIQDNPLQTRGEVYTTLDNTAQGTIERHITNYIERNRINGINNASALLLDYKTMEIIAEVGSADFFSPDIQGQVNGTAAKRSPGSALKPFIYALALDQGIIHSESLMKDAPKRFGAYTPENYDQKFIGPISANDALILSRNVPAVALMRALAKPDLYDFLRMGNIKDMKDREHYGLALALGGMEVTMHELARLYAVLANLGVWREAVSIGTDGDKNPSYQRLLSQEAAYITLKMLEKNQPTDRINYSLGNSHYPVAWKTGTSYAFRDAWSVGVFGSYVMAVWVGNFSGEGHPSLIGRKAAAPLFFEIVRSLEKQHGDFGKHKIFDPDLEVLEIDVCASTGDLPDRFCPETKKAFFIPAKSPIKSSNIYREIYINKKSGMRACFFDPEKTKKVVYEFWPSDLLQLFELAGIRKNIPPPFDGVCNLNETSNTGVKPEITSPMNEVIYALQAGKLSEERIPFTAVVDADVKWLYWFLDNRFLGRSEFGETFFWKPELGDFEVRAVDDHGRADSKNIAVHLAQ